MKFWNVFISNAGLDLINRYSAQAAIDKATERRWYRLLDSQRRSQARVDLIVFDLQQRAKEEEPNPGGRSGVVAPWVKLEPAFLCEICNSPLVEFGNYGWECPRGHQKTAG